jgi:Protein of unknown function (DUF2845)
MLNIMKRVSVALLLGLSVGVASADGDFRCGGKIITTGMTQSQVIDACGEPATREVEDVDVRSGNQVIGRTAVWRWTYEMNGTKRLLVFDQETLKSIE